MYPLPAPPSPLCSGGGGCGERAMYSPPDVSFIIEPHTARSTSGTASSSVRGTPAEAARIPLCCGRRGWHTEIHHLSSFSSCFEGSFGRQCFPSTKNTRWLYKYMTTPHISRATDYGSAIDDVDTSTIMSRAAPEEGPAVFVDGN